MRRSHVLEVACGGAHTIVLTSSREVFSWGSGFFGQLGHGDGKDAIEPRWVEPNFPCGSLKITPLTQASARNARVGYKTAAGGGFDV